MCAKDAVSIELLACSKNISFRTLALRNKHRKYKLVSSALVTGEVCSACGIKLLYIKRLY